MGGKSTTLILLFVSVLSFGQTHTITKVLETNLFQLDNDEKVRLSGLYIPALNDSNKAMSYLAEKVFSWENKALVGNKFDFEFTTENPVDGVSSAKVYIQYPVSRYNLAGHLLAKGYAAILNDADSTFYGEVYGEQETAQFKKYGMWNYDEPAKRNFVVVPYSGRMTHTYKSLYLPLAALTLLTLALGYETFHKDNLVEDPDTRMIYVGTACLLTCYVTTSVAIRFFELRKEEKALSVSYSF